MDDGKIYTGIDIDSKINEAEAYRSMGLFTESLDVYEKILLKLDKSDPAKHDGIMEKIERLKEEMADQDAVHEKTVSPEDISHFKKTVSKHESVTAILGSASAWKELGLFGEAAEEYKKLFCLDCHPGEIASEMVQCLLKLQSPSKALEHVERVVEKQDLGKKERVQIKFRLGIEMEKRDYKDLALDLYRSAKEIDPADKEIKGRLDSVIASLSPGSRYDHLLSAKIVTPELLQQALRLSKRKKKSVEFVLIDHFGIKKEDVGTSLSRFYGSPFKSYDSELPTPTELLGNLKKIFLLHEHWVPLSWGKEGIEILIDDPVDLTKTDHIRALVKTKKISFSVAIKEDIESYIKRFFDEKKIDEGAPVEEVMDGLGLIPDISFEEEEEEAEAEQGEFDESSGQVVKLVDQLLIAAYRKDASDIHFEPSPVSKATTIRFRIDGVCQDYTRIPNHMALGVISRIKVMAGVDITERRLPQDGKIKFRRKGIPSFEIRMVTLPTTGGMEDVVLRILAKAGAMGLDEMDLSERDVGVMKKILAQPYGLILAAGPTGSGKTTTLHAALNFVNKPGIKIWTAEDPVEITQAGLRQVEMKSKIGLDFATIMRAFLRADPDVIMIGEMRDEDTASIGIEASLTGHLVLSTLHTNSAPETVTRLLDMGLNPLNFSDAFLGVLAQRLVRRLCKKCREPYHVSKEEFAEIVSDYGEDYFEDTGITYSQDLSFYRPVGCEACSGTGYKGRLGIFELMEGSAEIKRMIKKHASAEMLFEQAQKERMTTLKQDGIIKVFRGLTDISEIQRVCIK